MACTSQQCLHDDEPGRAGGVACAELAAAPVVPVLSSRCDVDGDIRGECRTSMRRAARAVAGSVASPTDAPLHRAALALIGGIEASWNAG